MRLIMAISTGILMMFFSFLVYRKDIVFAHNLRYYLKIIVISFAIALFISYLNPDNAMNTIVFLLMMVMLPLTISSNQAAIKKEKNFNDLIIWCNNMLILLKQKQSLNNALLYSSRESNEELQATVENLINHLSENKNVFQKVLADMYRKYPYTIIRQLSIILLTYYYDNSENIERLLEVFENDLNKLVEDVKENQNRRKALRIQYIGISLGCIIVMWLMCSQFAGIFPKMNKQMISDVALLFYITTLIIMFMVDLYFTSHLTEE